MKEEEDTWHKYIYSTHTVQLEIESTSIAHRFSLIVAAPECGRRGGAVGAGESGSTIVGHLLARLDGRTVHPVHLGVEATCVAQVVTGSVTSPERGLDGTAVHTLPGLQILCASVEPVCPIRGQDRKEVVMFAPVVMMSRGMIVPVVRVVVEDGWSRTCRPSS